jgi:hypothetical protein
MSQSQEQLAEEVVSLACRYRKQEELSIYEMLKRTGYLDRRETLTVEALRKALARSPNHLNDWLAYSADKRTGDGWYIRGENGRFEVGHLDTDARVAERRIYSDLEEACADLIQHEVDRIAFE